MEASPNFFQIYGLHSFMIPAQKNPWMDAAMFWYLKRMLKKSFYDIRIRGQDQLQKLSHNLPVIAFSNHTNWWDGLIAFRFTRLLPSRSFFCMMEEKQLCHYPFLTRLGAFSVDLTSSRRAAISLRYAFQLLQSPHHLLWIFPQGKMTSPHRKILVQPGTSFLGRRLQHVHMLPIAFRYEFFREDRPQIFIEIGTPFLGKESTDLHIQTALTSVSNRLNQSIIQQDTANFDILMKPTMALNKKWECFYRRLQGKSQDFCPYH